MLITSIRIPNAHVISPHFFEFFFFHLPELISCHRQNGANECVDDHTERSQQAESFDHTEDADEAQHLVLA